MAHSESQEYVLVDVTVHEYEDKIILVDDIMYLRLSKVKPTDIMKCKPVDSIKTWSSEGMEVASSFEVSDTSVSVTLAVI